MSKVQLKAGDYVLTKGMTEEQYHGVAKAFLAAGCHDVGRASLADDAVGWDKRDDEFTGRWISTNIMRNAFSGRELTIEQVLGQQEDSPLTIEQLLAKANRHAAKAAKHERKRAELVELADKIKDDEMKAELEEMYRVYISGAKGHCGGIKALYDAGYRLTAAKDDEPVEDMTDPANWKAGDVVECMTNSATYFSAGRHYRLLPWPSNGAAMNKNGNVQAIDDEGDDYHEPATSFKWISRPQGESA